MSKLAIGIVLLIIFVVVFGVAAFYLRQPERLVQRQPRPASVVAPSPAPASSTPTPASTPESDSQPIVRTDWLFSDKVTVEMVPNGYGFSPANLTISVNTTVTFINKDTKARWPASGVHPTHQICPGFDPLKPIPAGESWNFTFTVAKTCPMHDHLYPALRGSIVVQ